MVTERGDGKLGTLKKLAKVSGIMLVHPRLKFAIESHSHGVGHDDYIRHRQRTGSKTAQDYLLSFLRRAVARGKVLAKPGLFQAISLRLDLNRQRVELVVTGKGITGAPAADQNPLLGGSL